MLEALVPEKQTDQILPRYSKKMYKTSNLLWTTKSAIRLPAREKESREKDEKDKEIERDRKTKVSIGANT